MDHMSNYNTFIDSIHRSTSNYYWPEILRPSIFKLNLFFVSHKGENTQVLDIEKNSFYMNTGKDLEEKKQTFREL